MQLFSKYNRINIISTVIIFLLGCIAFSFLLRYVIINQIDEDLKIEQNEIITYTEHNHHLPGIVEVHDQYTVYKKIRVQQLMHAQIHTRNVYDSAEHEKELQRTIEFNIQSGNEWYNVTVSKSLEGIDDLIQTIIIITVTLILLILAATFIINRIVLKKLWQPFYKTLKTTHAFSINNNEKVFFQSTNIDEFNYLNETLTEAFGKAQRDYQTLKEFTENASHELQTPVAIIRSKLDNLIQYENLTQQQSHAVEEAYNALNRLNKLNQSLLLLTKIENHQFAATTQINLKEKTESKLNQFCELWQRKNIAVNITLEEAYISINETLIDVLLNNLLNNAVKHNVYNGSIDISLDNYLLIIDNTGISQPLDEKLLFTRFYKANADVESNGLGLSIVKQICDVSACKISYYFKAPGTHSFILQW